MPDNTITVTPSAWAALQVQARFYNLVSAFLDDKKMTDISILASIYVERAKTERELKKIRGQD